MELRVRVPVLSVRCAQLMRGRPRLTSAQKHFAGAQLYNLAHCSHSRGIRPSASLSLDEANQSLATGDAKVHGGGRGGGGEHRGSNGWQ